MSALEELERQIQSLSREEFVEFQAWVSQFDSRVGTQQKRPTMLGLALSGGGFRASFFHLGLLAQLAQQGLLGLVKVISTVSGGSIIGALYYLRLIERLQSQLSSGGELTDEDYQELLEEIEREFFNKVRKVNFRQGALTPLQHPIRFVKAIVSADYSRTNMLADLMDDKLYTANSGKKVRLKDLWIDRNKAPYLLINATTLNTGHNWRFEPRVMGEADLKRDETRKEEITRSIDQNLHLVRTEPGEDLLVRDVSLGEAVAASAAVPGIFPVLPITGMYNWKNTAVRAELSDGGLHDNLGIEALLHMRCDVLIVSDGSRQMDDLVDLRTAPVDAQRVGKFRRFLSNPTNKLSPPFITMLKRTNDILMDRVREEQLFRLHEYAGANYAGANKVKLAWFHLRQGLLAEDLYPVRKGGGDKSPTQSSPSRSQLTTPENFGVCSETQRLLSSIRTDLDCFTDVEAYSLMLDSYLMSETQLAKMKNDVFPGGRPNVHEARWEFLKVKPYLCSRNEAYLGELELGQLRLFKGKRKSLGQLTQPSSSAA